MFMFFCQNILVLPGLESTNVFMKAKPNREDSEAVKCYLYSLSILCM